MTLMSRIVSIDQPEPGLYIVKVQRTRMPPLGMLLKAIADPPLDVAGGARASDVVGNGRPDGAGHRASASPQAP